MEKGFHRRIYTAGLFIKDISYLLYKLPMIIGALRNKEISKLFMEKNAQHYAETNRQTDPEMDRQLVAFYGEKTAAHILMIIRIIFFGNLTGNTFDAFLSRLQGLKAPGSNVVFETVFFLLFAIILLPLRPFIKKQHPGENP